MKLATWNVNSLKVRLGHVLDWLKLYEPDALCLQEIKLEDDKFPSAEFEAAGYRCAVFGQKTYNGVAIVARDAPEDVVRGMPEYDDDQRRVLAATIHGVRVVSAYVVNGQAVDSEKFSYKLTWLEHFTRHLERELQAHAKLAVLGDYNIAPEDRDVHDPELWREQVLCSTRERDAYKRLLALGFKDAFRLFEQADKSYSWWDYREMAFRRNRGLRIDHILLSEPLAKTCSSCIIDKSPRKLERPSDHAPVIATIEP